MSNSNDTKNLDFVWDNTDTVNTFPSNRPEEPITLPVQSNRIDTGLYLATQRITELTNKHEKAILIFQLLRLYITTSQFYKIKEKSRQGYLNAIHYFVTWLNTQVSVSNKIVKNFETEQVNNRKIKPESTGAGEILHCIKAALPKASIAGSHLKFINTIINKSNLIPNSNLASSQATLTGYFLEHPWIENEMGNKQFLKLASPKRLMESFRVIVAESLSYLRKARNVLLDNNEVKSAMLNREIDFNQRKKLISMILDKSISFDEFKRPLNLISNILVIDTLRTKFENQAIDSFINGELVHKDTLYKNQIFVGDIFEKSISELEEILMAFLCASYSIQPDDIFKLKKTHFAIVNNSRNEPRNISITYFKGRAGNKYDTPVLSLKHSGGRALHEYLESMPKNQEYLFTKKLGRIKLSAHSVHSVKNHNSISSFLIRLWCSNHFRTQVIPILKNEGKSTIFLDCISAISSPRAFPFSAWKTKNKGLYQDYIASNELTQPIYLFGLAHIKNTAVHSRADKYRDGDLKNYNSHTSLTEKTSYLGPDNQEFKDQAGRISRAILEDIESSVYQPNLNKVREDVHDKKIRTHLVSVTGNDDLTVKPISTENDLESRVELDFDDIQIIESKETVIHMLHYIAQTEKYSEQLSKKNPEFFYYTALVNVEWFKYVLSDLFNPKSESFIQGKNHYERIKAHLPELFFNELYGGLG